MTDPEREQGGEEFDFERTLRELEEIVSKLDREEVGLDEAMALFRDGVTRLEAANKWLGEASGRVEELIENASGALETRPLDDDD